MVIRKLLVLILILIFSCVPVNALEYDYNSSGTVSYYVGDSLSYSWTATIGNCERSWVSSQFSHLFTDAKILNRVIFSSTSFWDNSLSYTKNSASPFTATVGSTYYGSGIVSVYEDDFGKIYWDIDFNSVDEEYASSLNGVQYVVLTSDSNVWVGISSATTSRYVTTNPPVSSKPTQMMVSTNQLLTKGYDVLVSYNTAYNNDYEYGFNSSYNISSVSITRSDSSIWSIFDYNNTLYFEDADYSITDISQDFVRYQGVYANITFNVGGGYVISKILDVNGTIYDEEEEDEDEDDFEYNITTELDEYSPGDTVNVTYTTDQKGTIQVVKTISGDIYHSIGFVSGATNATWDFYIAENEPYGFYDVYLLDSSNTILDSVRYSLLPTTSSLDILQSSVDLHETFVVFAQTVNESILSIEDPDGVEVWNEHTIN
jgi:hypothetical protein